MRTVDHKRMSITQIEQCHCPQCQRWDAAIAEGETRADTNYQRRLRQIRTALAALMTGDAG